MVEARFTHSAQTSEEPVELFEYIEQEISKDITRQDTPMREADTPNRRLAITLYYAPINVKPQWGEAGCRRGI